jgi:hypothetical protein
VVYHNQNYWVFGLFPSSVILKTSKHTVSETGSVSVLRCVGGGRLTPSSHAPAVLKCEQLSADPNGHGGAHHQMSAFHAFCSEWPYAVLFFSPQYTSDVIVVPCCMNSTISTPLLSQKIVHQLSGRQHLFKLFQLV